MDLGVLLVESSPVNTDLVPVDRLLRGVVVGTVLMVAWIVMLVGYIVHSRLMRRVDVVIVLNHVIL
jgi:hypothetical protein